MENMESDEEWGKVQQVVMKIVLKKISQARVMGTDVGRAHMAIETGGVANAASAGDKRDREGRDQAKIEYDKMQKCYAFASPGGCTRRSACRFAHDGGEEPQGKRGKKNTPPGSPKGLTGGKTPSPSVTFMKK